MSRTSMFLLGALGGLLPILVSLLTIDVASFTDGPHALTIGNYIGYGLRVFILLLLGGVMASLNSEVRTPMSLVQLGIAAPALITSYMNGTSLKPPPSPSATNDASLSFVSPAYSAPSNRQAPYVVAVGFLSDIQRGFGTRLDTLQQQNRAIEGAAKNIPLLPMPQPDAPPPTAPGPTSPVGWGAYCLTSVGKFGPGPLVPLGTPCGVPTTGGVANGIAVSE